MTGHSNFQQASTRTVNDLRGIADTLSKENLSRLSLPEIDAAVKLVAQVVPAGNVPGMILSVLARMLGRKPAVRQDVNALFTGMEQVLDQAVFTAAFVLPARVIWGYQNLLRLAGKDLDECFPEGTWQFYVDYALREDTARHANETHGFDTLLKQHQIRLSAVDRLTAWTMAVVTCLNSLPDLLANEWYERASIALLQQVSRSYRDGSKYEGLFRQWESKRPYRREAEGANLNYPAYRRKKFNEFLAQPLRALPESAHRAWMEKLRAAEKTDLPAYQRQMTLLAYLDPGQYGETRTPFSIRQAQVAFVVQGQYFLLPVCDPDGKPLDVLSMRAQIASMLESIHDHGQTPARLDSLARVRRAALPDLRLKLDPRLVAELDRLRFASVIFNADPRPRALPLAELRRAERGCGDHALTIFDTGETLVFDQSHIFFDGSWGAALAEIMTNEALSWAGYLNMLPPAVPAHGKQHWSRLAFQISSADMDSIQQAPHCTLEADAETTRVNLKACLNLRKIFKQRNDLLQLTVNDLLVLYRAIHAATYQPSEGLRAELEKLSATAPEADSAIRTALDGSRETNPSILIPVDASQNVPRERVYPLNVEVPLAELDLLNLHAQSSVRALDAYEFATGDRKAIYAEFDGAQRTYLASLAGFGSFLKKAREIAVQGQSASVGAIKLLAHLHPVLQRLLDKVPERFELLNNLLKGREVFSNVGAVAPSSTLTRFITAKDDNEQKHLAWGVMTDAAGVMAVSLRDFRPHVAMLYSMGRRDLAAWIVQDYLDSYALGFNAYIRDLFRITKQSRETKSTQAKRIKRND